MLEHDCGVSISAQSLFCCYMVSGLERSRMLEHENGASISTQSLFCCNMVSGLETGPRLSGLAVVCTYNLG